MFAEVLLNGYMFAPHFRMLGEPNNVTMIDPR